MLKDIIAKVAKMMAEQTLARDANRTTCGAFYQPKAPIGLERFKQVEKSK